MASNAVGTSSSQIQTTQLRDYPLNSFSGEETAIKVSALVLALLCIGGAVAIAMGGQFVLPEIIMAPIPQLIIEATLGLAAIGLLIEVIVFSVKAESTEHNQESNPDIDRAKLASFDDLSKESKKAQATIDDLKARIEGLQQTHTTE